MRSPRSDTSKNFCLENFFFSKSLDLFIIDTRNNVYLIKELPQEPTYFDCIGKSPTMGHDSDDGDLIRKVIMLKVKGDLYEDPGRGVVTGLWPRSCLKYVPKR